MSDMKKACNILSLVLVMACSFSACKSASQVLEYKPYESFKIGRFDSMKENLMSTTEGFVSYCYNNSIKNCSLYGALFNWAYSDSICPAGRHLPSTSEMVEFIDGLSGKTNINKGQLVNEKTIEKINLKYGGGLTMIEGKSNFYGIGNQEIWLMASDSIWINPNNLEEKYQLTALHMHKKGKDSVTIEPTFSDNPKEFYGYCRCIKDSY